MVSLCFTTEQLQLFGLQFIWIPTYSHAGIQQSKSFSLSLSTR